MAKTDVRFGIGTITEDGVRRVVALLRVEWCEVPGSMVVVYRAGTDEVLGRCLVGQDVEMPDVRLAVTEAGYEFEPVTLRVVPCGGCA